MRYNRPSAFGFIGLSSATATVPGSTRSPFRATLAPAGVRLDGAGRPAFRLGILCLGLLAIRLSLAPAPASAQGDGSQQYFETTPMPIVRDKLGAAVAGDFLYVVGGHTSKGTSSEVLYAPIAPDGTLGPWSPTTPMPEPRLYLGNCTLGVGNVVYVAGGNIFDTKRNLSSPDVLYGKATPDGSIAEWKRSPVIPGPPVQCNVALHVNGNLYVIGGANDANEPQQVTYRAPIQAGGDIGEWAMDQPLPVPLWFHCGASANGRIYIWGGTSSPKGHPRLAECYSAVVQPNGSLGPWGVEPPLPFPLSLAQASSVGPFILNFAGLHEDNKPSTSIFFGLTTPDGLTAGWTPVLTNLPITCYAAAAYDPKREVVYLPGGQTSIPNAPQQALTREASVFGFRVLGSSNGGTRSAASSGGTGNAAIPAAPSGPAPVVDWQTVQQGFQTSRATGKPLLIVLGSKSLGVSAQFWANVIQNPGFGGVAAKHVCAIVDVEQDPGTAMQLGIFRVPAVVVLGPDGRLLAPPLMTDISLQQLQALP